MCPNFVAEASVFQEPGVYASMLERYRAGRTREELLRGAGGQEMKDAWQACLLALGYQEWRKEQTDVRICAPEQFPDLQVRVAGHVSDFEATMVMEPGRRLGDEYHGDRTPGPPPIRREQGALPPFDPELLRQAIRAKAGRRYAARPHLLVYLNLRASAPTYFAMVAESAIPEADSFESIWVIGGVHLGCLKRVPSLPSPEGWKRIPIEVSEPGGPV
jgi:hypothetical protein